MNEPKPTVATRLSPRAQAILGIAHELARREPGSEPHGGHLLLALLRTGGGVIEDTAARLEIAYESVAGAVEAAARSAPSLHTGDAGASALRSQPGLSGILAGADTIARHSGQVYIAAEHLLLALLEDEEGIARTALAALDVDPLEATRVVRAPRDMLVPLLALPDPAPAVERARLAGVVVRRARAWEGPALAAFITAQAFSRTWAPEAANAFARRPQSVFLAVRGDAIAGFAAYDCGLRGIFGPTGVAREERTGGIASALLLRCLADMRAVGYAYAIIGAVGPAEFYERVCGAVLLPSAWPSYVNTAD